MFEEKPHPPPDAVIPAVPRAPVQQNTEATMAIQWKHDLDAALQRARDAEKPILLDFSAAPM